MSKYIISFLLVLCSWPAMAQQISPYSRYGAGDIRQQTFGAVRAMGGIGSAYQSPFNMNYVNPASYATVAQTSLGMALKFNTSTLSVKDTSYQTGDAFIDYLALGVPLLPNRLDGKKWGACFGVVPYSQMNYELSDKNVDSNGLTYSHLFSGSGRLYDMFIGTGVQFSIQDSMKSDSSKFPPIHKIALGFNMTYRFGNMSYSELLELENATSYFNTRDKLNVRANDIVWTAGVQYKLQFGQDKADSSLTAKKKASLFEGVNSVEGRSYVKHKSFTLGAYTSVPMNLDASVNRVYDRYIVSGSSTATVDTVLDVAESKVKLNFPVVVGTGFSFGDDQRWLWGVDVRYTAWTGYNNVANDVHLHDTWRIGTGFEIIPDYRGKSKKGDKTHIRYFKRVSYRLGGYYENGALKLNGTNISQYGMTFGLGLPLTSYSEYYKGASISYLNLSFDIGSRGTTNNDLIGEFYFGGTIGILLNDRWFVQRKYN